MAARVNVVLDPAGVAVNINTDQEVKTQYNPSVAVIAYPGRTIWTQNMTECASIASFDHADNSRTLCHAGGGNFLGFPAYIKDLVGKISADTTIIFALGANWVSSPSTREIIAETKLAIQAEMVAQRKASNLLTWVEYWSPGFGPGQENGSFVLRADGVYGMKLR